jgi:hypothetical protein
MSSDNTGGSVDNRLENGARKKKKKSRPKAAFVRAQQAL